MEKQRRIFTLLSLVFSLLATAVVSTSFATDYWTTSSLKQTVNKTISEQSVATSEASGIKTYNEQTADTGHMNFGLFRGSKVFLTVFGARTSDVWVACNWEFQVCGLSSNISASVREERIKNVYQILVNDTQEISNDILAKEGLFSYPLWLTVAIFSSAAMFWGAMVLVFTTINIFIVPIETINGLQGLYFWNILACICTLGSLVTFGILHSTNISVNVLLEQEDLKRNWETVGQSLIGWSYWLQIASTVLYAVACVFVKLATADLQGCGVGLLTSNSHNLKAEEAATAMSILY